MSFLDMCHSSNAYLLGDADYEDAFYEGPRTKGSGRRNYFKYDELYHYFDLKMRLVLRGIIKRSDELTVKAETPKAKLFAINNTPLFWVPKKLIKNKKGVVYVNNCFDIDDQLTYQG